jgi:hypothetical protein
MSGDEWERLSEQNGDATISADDAMLALFNADLPALCRLELIFSDMAPYGGFYWEEGPEEINPNVFPALERFEVTNLRICPAAAAYLATTVGGRPGCPVRVLDERLDFATRSIERDSAETRIRERFAISAFSILNEAYECECGWGEAVALGGLPLLEYKALAFMVKAGDLMSSVDWEGHGPAIATADAKWYLAAARTDPDLLPENQSAKTARWRVEEAWKCLEKLAQGIMPPY